jgi:hemerythrin-like domain-containing protein
MAKTEIAQMPDPLALGNRDALPDALRVLAAAYPRMDWERHPNFGEMIRFWMQRHAMFRQLLYLLKSDAEAALSGQMEATAHAKRLSHFGGTLLNELHGHHQIEDGHYFPRLIKLDARLERGFDLLEKDHEAMDGLLHAMAEGANEVLKGGEVSPLLDRLEDFERMLKRHLADEEDIVVPVVLHTGFSG